MNCINTNPFVGSSLPSFAASLQFFLYDSGIVIPQLDEVIIISDMEFDAVQNKSDMSNFKYWKSEFAKHNYKLPKIILLFPSP